MTNPQLPQAYVIKQELGYFTHALKRFFVREYICSHDVAYNLLHIFSYIDFHLLIISVCVRFQFNSMSFTVYTGFDR